MTSDDHTITRIRELWNLATPLPEIASTLHLPDAFVRHVLQTGTLPDEQPRWIQPDLFDHQPTRDAVSDK